MWDNKTSVTIPDAVANTNRGWQTWNTPTPTKDPNDAIKKSLNAQIKEEGNGDIIKITDVEIVLGKATITYTIWWKEKISKPIKTNSDMEKFTSNLKETWSNYKKLQIMQKNIPAVAAGWTTSNTPSLLWEPIPWVDVLSTQIDQVDITDPNATTAINNLQTQYDTAVKTAIDQIPLDIPEDQQWARFWEFLSDGHCDMFDINDKIEKIFYRAYDLANNGQFTGATIAMSWDNLHWDVKGKANQFDAKIPVWKTLKDNKKKLIWIVLVWEALNGPTGLNECYANVIDESNPEDAPNWSFGWVISSVLTGKLTEAWLVQLKSDNEMYIVEVWDQHAHETIRIEGGKVDKWATVENPIYMKPKPNGNYSFKWDATWDGATQSEAVSFEKPWLKDIVETLYDPVFKI